MLLYLIEQDRRKRSRVKDREGKTTQTVIKMETLNTGTLTRKRGGRHDVAEEK